MNLHSVASTYVDLIEQYVRSVVTVVGSVGESELTGAGSFFGRAGVTVRLQLYDSSNTAPAIRLQLNSSS